MHERQAINFSDDEGGAFNATWSRSGKRLIVTVDRRENHAQVELRPGQARVLWMFLAETSADTSVVRNDALRSEFVV